MKKIKILSLVSITIIIIFVIFYFSKSETTNFTTKQPITEKNNLYTPVFTYGLNLDSFVVDKGTIKANDFLSNILLKYHVSYPVIDKLAKKSKPIFDVRKIAEGKNYTILFTKDSTRKVQYFIYEPNETDYIVYNLRDTIAIYKGKKKVITKIRTAAGIITSSLYQTLDDANISPVLAIEMANVYAWTIDFYRIQKNDWFKVIYQENFVNGKSIGIRKILAANFHHYDKDYFAYYFKQDNKGDYFDNDAQSLRRAFLKSPLKFGRLTSGYTMRRFHPIQKRMKPHLGTDYAAPTGTPIMATGDGVVIASTFSKYNGNFVKIRHNSTYTTQYLHMSKRAVKVGQHVAQSDIIGYVGSTGLATGPHVCYRFWKNGKQVNSLKQDLPPSIPVKKENLEKFKKIAVKYQVELSLIK